MRQKCKDCFFFEKYNGMPYCAWFSHYIPHAAPMPLKSTKVNQYNNCEYFKEIKK